MMRLAIVGCGSVSELFHLPAARDAGFEVVSLVDTDTRRARELALQHGVPHVSSGLDSIPEVDAAIVATPSYLHAPVSIALLERHVHVLVEKPLATEAREAREMVRVAERTGSQLHIGLMHRFFSQNRFVRQAVCDGVLGRLRSFSLEFGNVGDWSPRTSYATDRRQAGGGILIDLGSHVLDLARWWLGPLQLRSYRDDSRGGVEAECELEVVVGAGETEVPGRVVLSRLRGLRNRARLEGDEVCLDVDVGPGYVRVAKGHLELPDDLPRPEDADRIPRYVHAFRAQMHTFGDAVRGERAPVVPAQEAVPTIELIEDCYRERQPLVAPWELS